MKEKNTRNLFIVKKGALLNSKLKEGKKIVICPLCNQPYVLRYLICPECRAKTVEESLENEEMQKIREKIKVLKPSEQEIRGFILEKLKEGKQRTLYNFLQLFREGGIPISTGKYILKKLVNEGLVNEERLKKKFIYSLKEEVDVVI